MAAIWVFAEYSNGAMDKVTYEAVSEARRLADAQGAPVAAVAVSYTHLTLPTTERV